MAKNEVPTVKLRRTSAGNLRNFFFIFTVQWVLLRTHAHFVDLEKHFKHMVSRPLYDQTRPKYFSNFASPQYRTNTP